MGMLWDPIRRLANLITTRHRFLMAVIVAGAFAAAACGSSLAPAPDFQISLHQGEEILGASQVSLSSLQGKPVVLNFWAGLCPPCRAEMPDLQEFHEEYQDQVYLIGVDLGSFFAGLGNKQDGIELLKELEVTYPAGFTDDIKVVKNYGVLGMPSTIFITADGKIFRKWTGLLNKEKLAEISEKMLES